MKTEEMNFTEEFLDAYRKIVEENLLLKQQFKELKIEPLKVLQKELKEESLTVPQKELLKVPQKEPLTVSQKESEKEPLTVPQKDFNNEIEGKIYRKYSLIHVKKYLNDVKLTSLDIDNIVNNRTDKIRRGRHYIVNIGSKRQGYLCNILNLFKEIVKYISSNVDKGSISILNSSWVYRNFEVIFLLEKFLKICYLDELKVILLNPLGVKIDYFNMNNKDFEDLIKEFNSPQGQGFRWKFNEFIINIKKAPLTIIQKEPFYDLEYFNKIVKDKQKFTHNLIIYLNELPKNIVKKFINDNSFLKTDNNTPLLIYSVQLSLNNLTKVLLDLNYDVNITDNNNQTALMYACRYGCKTGEIIELLVKTGANVKHSTKHGETALHNAEKNEFLRDNNQKIIKLLKDVGA